MDYFAPPAQGRLLDECFPEASLAQSTSPAAAPGVLKVSHRAQSHCRATSSGCQNPSRSGWPAPESRGGAEQPFCPCPSGPHPLTPGLGPKSVPPPARATALPSWAAPKLLLVRTPHITAPATRLAATGGSRAGTRWSPPNAWGSQALPRPCLLQGLHQH